MTKISDVNLQKNYETSIYREYFDFICKLVYDNKYYSKKSYKKLLGYLDTKKFIFTNELDKSRAIDGIHFRYHFGYVEGYDDDYIKENLDLYPCSMLEMMIALAYRVEDQIMSDPRLGNRTGQWFWGMIVSLGLGQMDDFNFDERYCDSIIERFINNDYESNGVGGLFTLDHPADDVRNVSIWCQFMWYLNEIGDI